MAKRKRTNNNIENTKQKTINRATRTPLKSGRECRSSWRISSSCSSCGTYRVTPVTRRVWRYQRGNQIPYIEEQTTQWPKKKYKRTRSTKDTYKTKDRVTQTPLKSVIFHEWGNNCIVITINRSSLSISFDV